MKTKKIAGIIICSLLLMAGVADGVRYTRPLTGNKQEVQPPNRFSPTSYKEIILVYNAWGGIYPGIADFINKEFFPSSYPCNLCYQTFGMFGMKDKWRAYLDSLPYKITELHKDNFRRMYRPEKLALPAILVSNGTSVQLLATAEELNGQKSLEALMGLVDQKLKPSSPTEPSSSKELR
jgi:hypothetical protein